MLSRRNFPTNTRILAADGRVALVEEGDTGCLALAGEVGYDALCRRLKMEKSTASRNIERMKKRGWLKIVTIKEERRKLLRLTPAGEVLLGKVQEAWEDAQEKALSLLGEEGAEVLCNIANGIWKKDKAR